MELSEVIDAYFDCRRHKRNTSNALHFEMEYEAECIKLWEDINARRYKPGRSIAFVVEHPVKREIFAADFRDRVVHHIISRRIFPLLAKQFIEDSYSTQAGKGTLFGIRRSSCSGYAGSSDSLPRNFAGEPIFPTRYFEQQGREGAAFPTTSSLSPK